MNIVEFWQKSNGAKTHKSLSEPIQPKSPRSEFQEIRRDLAPEIQQDISNFRVQFPQLKEHVIYRIMKKHDLKHNLVESELRFIADMQGTQPVEQKEKKPKKQWPPKDSKGGDGESPKFVEEARRDAPHHPKQSWKKDFDPASERAQRIPRQNGHLEGGRERHQNQKEGERPFQGRQDRLPRDREWKGRYRNDRQLDQEAFRPANQDFQVSPSKPGQFHRHTNPQNSSYRKQHNGNLSDRPPNDRPYNNKLPLDRQNADRPYNRDHNDRNVQKRSKNYHQNQRESGEYVAKPTEEQRPKPSKPQPEPEQEKGLSKINEESEDMSQHRANVDESAEIRQPASAQKSIYQVSAREKSGHDQDWETRPHERPHQTTEIPEAHLAAQLHVPHLAPSQHNNTPSPTRIKQNWEKSLLSNGLAILNKFFLRSDARHFRQFIHCSRSMESKSKTDGRLATDKRPPFIESKKRKPAIKNNFETDENDESYNERAKKMNHLVSHRRFESEDERMKGDRERAMESKINDSISQFNFLAQKIKSLEAEVVALRTANHELAERNRDQAQNGEDNIFCFVPYHFVKDWYPFNSIRVGDLRAGNVYMVKKDD
jgi:hypothetical protein